LCGDNGFWDGAHADGIATHQMSRHENFSASFVARPGHGYIDAFTELDLEFKANGTGQHTELWVVDRCMLFVEITVDSAVILLTDERMAELPVDMVGDEHQISNGKRRIEAAGRVADDDVLQARKRFYYEAGQRCRLGRSQTLVDMTPAGHYQHRYACGADPGVYETTGVARNGRAADAGDFAVGDFCQGLQSTDEAAEAAAGNDECCGISGAGQTCAK